MQSNARRQQIAATIELAFIAAGNLIAFAFDSVLLAVVMAALLFFVLRKYLHGAFSLHTPITFGVVCLLLSLGLSAVITADSSVTLPAVYRVLAGMALFYALAHATQSIINLRWLLLGLAGLGAAFALVGITLVPKAELLAPLQRIVPQLNFATINPNILGGLLAAIVPVIVSVLLWDWATLNWMQRFAFIGAASIMGAVILATVSRASIANMLIGVAIVGWFFRPKITTLTLIGNVIGVSIAVIGWRDVLLSNFIESIILPELQTRLEIWSRSLHMLEDFASTGVGMGLFGRIADLAYPFFLSAPGTIPHAHNVYLQVGIDLGVVGLIGWLTIVVTMLALALKLFRHNHESQQPLLAACAAGLFASQIAMLLHGFIDAPLWNTRVAVIVWVLWGLTMFCYNQTNWDQKEAQLEYQDEPLVAKV